MIKKKTTEMGLDKASIVTEYLTQENTFKTLGKKYGIHDRTIQSWVRAYRKGRLSLDDAPREPIKEKELRKELHKLQLKNELLEEILEIAKQQTGVDLRKKYGAKQS